MRKSGFRHFPAALVPMSAMLMMCLAQSPDRGEPTSPPEQSLKRFLQDYVKEKHLDDDGATRYSCAFVDLNGGGRPEAIVYLEGRWWCGSGGCPMLVLSRNESSWRVITKTTITRPPYQSLNERVSRLARYQRVGPGRWYSARLRSAAWFNGETYPSNPSVPPAQPLTKRAEGKIVIPQSAKGTLLYQ